MRRHSGRVRWVARTSVSVGLALLCCSLSAAQGSAPAAGSAPSAADLTEISLEELLGLEVTTVSKKPERLSRAPAAVHVITSEDIERTGYESIPELLRLVPGIQVGRVDAHQWGVSARGFNDVFANKLLVMIDGRSVYTPLFSGVFWDVQDTLLEDIERIEVIRGPGATLWGANAVTGVINIITRPAAQTQGGMISAAAGDQDRYAAFRYGGALGAGFHYRIYAKAAEGEPSRLSTGSEAFDAWRSQRAGVRADGTLGDGSRLTFGAEAYSVDMEQRYTRLSSSPPFLPYTHPTEVQAQGEYLLARWTRPLDSGADLTLQAYVDRTLRDTAIFREDRTTVDIEFQGHLFRGAHDVVWGGGYRLTEDAVTNSFDVSLRPPSRKVSLWSAFFQDEISFPTADASITFGSKFEHNDYTGFEIQPSVRLYWAIGPSQAAWASVARAVRTPSRAEDDIRLNQPLVLPPGAGLPPAVTSLFGSREFGSETLLAYEMGYRVRPAGKLTLELAGFFNQFDDLRSLEAGSPFFRTDPLPHIALFAGNGLTAETYGFEVDAHWQAASFWRWSAGFSYLRMQVQPDPSSTDGRSASNLTGSSPRHQAFLQSFLDLPRRFSFDSTLRYTDSLPARRIGSYVELDVRLAWELRPDLTLSVVGRNLLDRSHPEFTPSFIPTQTTEVERSYYAKINWRF